LNHPEDYHEVLRRGGMLELLRSDAYRDVFGFISDHYALHGVVPSIDTVTERFSGLVLEDAPEPITYYIDLLVKRGLFDTLRVSSKVLQDRLRDGDLDSALDSFFSTSSSLAKIRSMDGGIHPVHHVDPRLAYYEARKSGECLGLPYPWEPFTHETLGLLPGELHIVSARTGIGKTWFTLLLSSTIWLLGRRVLFVSLEMDASFIHMRHDAMVARVPLSRLMSGTLSPSDEERYRKAMDEMRDYSGFDVADFSLSTDCDKISGLIESTEPDILIVDAAYFLTPRTKYIRGRTERLEAIAAELKQLALQYRIPVVASVQINREAVKRRKRADEQDLEDIYGSDAWAQNAGYVYILSRLPDDVVDDTARISCVKNRFGTVFAAKIRFDLDSMDFGLEDFQPGRKTLSVREAPSEEEEEIRL
jgi:replicative DNA helicase